MKLMNPWRRRGDGLSGPIRNVTIENNVFSGKWLSWHSVPVENVRVINNLFANIAADERFSLPSGVVSAGNVSFAPLHPIDDPETACQGKLAGRLFRATPFKVERPGPVWLEYETYPALRDASPLIAQWMKVADRCD